MTDAKATQEKTIYVGREKCGCVSLLVAKNSEGHGAKYIAQLLKRGGSLDVITDGEYQSTWKSWTLYNHCPHRKKNIRKKQKELAL